MRSFFVNTNSEFARVLLIGFAAYSICLFVALRLIVSG